MKWFLFVSLMLLPVLAGCDSQRETASEEAIFARSQGLPHIRDVRIQLDLPEQEVTVFRVTYGTHRPEACLDQPGGGCYSDAFGLRYREKIGWLDVLDRWGELDPSGLAYYTLEPADSYLYEEAFWQQFEEANQLLYQHRFLPMLVEQPHTPHEVLLRMSQELGEYINPSLGMLLVQRAGAGGHQAILQVLAALPVFQGDPYKDVRDLAAARLAAERST